MTSSSSDTTNSSLTGASSSSNDRLTITMVANDPSTIKKGLLWQQRDRFFSRWKERYFVLTKDYLSCFKKGSKVGMSEMGSFMYKLNLVDVEGLNWADKKKDGVIALRVGTEGQLLLWSNTGLDEWMFSLRDAVNRSKGRREQLRKSQTLLPSMTGGGIWNRQKLSMHHTMSDSPVCGSSTVSRLQRATSADFPTSDDRQLRSTIHHNPTPVLNRRFQRISVLTNIDLTSCFESGSGERRSIASGEGEHTQVTHSGVVPRLAPQCGGSGARTGQMVNSSQHSSLQSLVSFGRTNTCPSNNQLHRPSPRSLQVSPALAQRSLYAQHILSSPEIIGVNTTDSKHHQYAKSSLKSATSEFSFIRPDSPLTLPHKTRSSHVPSEASRGRELLSNRSQSYVEPHQQKQRISNNSNANSTLQYANRSANSSSSSRHTEKITQAPRPCSMYGQPSLTEKPFIIGNRQKNNHYYAADIVPSPNGTFSLSGNGHVTVIGVRDTKSMPKRHIRQYTHSKSDSVFNTANRPQSITSNGPTMQSPLGTSQGTSARIKTTHTNEIFAVR